MDSHSGASYLTAIIAFFTGLTIDEWSAVVGIIVAILGAILGIGTFLINWYYRHKDHKRKEELVSKESCLL
jgi:hypothetical protein